MLTRLTNTDLPKLLNYLKKDIQNCLYIYIDMRINGADGENVKAWYKGNLDNIELVVMEYYESVQIFSRANVVNPKELSSWLVERNFSRISSTKAIIQQLYPYMNGKYIADYGKIMKLSEYKKFSEIKMVRLATLEDIPEIAELIMNTEELSTAYTYEELCAQLSSRIKTSAGCSYYIRNGGKIVATASIVAQADDIYVASLTAVRKDSRTALWGVYIDSFLINHYKELNVSLYAMMTDEKRIKMFEKMGNTVVAEYGKILRIN